MSPWVQRNKEFNKSLIKATASTDDLLKKFAEMQFELEKLRKSKGNPLVHQFNAMTSDWNGIDPTKPRQGLVWQSMDADQRARRHEDADAYARALLEDD